MIHKYWIAASNSRGLLVRHLTDHAKGHTRPLRSPATTLSESGFSESHSSLRLPSPSPSPSDVDKQIRIPQYTHRYLILRPPSKTRNIKTQPTVSFEDLSFQALRKLIWRAQACSDIEDIAEWNSKVLSCQMEDELWQETKPMLRQYGLTTASQNEIRARYVAQVKKKRLEIKKNVLDDILRAVQLTNEMFERLKQDRRLRNRLAHPDLDFEDITAIVRDWVQEESRDRDDKT